VYPAEQLASTQVHHWSMDSTGGGGQIPRARCGRKTGWCSATVCHLACPHGIPQLTSRNAMVRWKASSKRVNELKGLMHSFKDLKLEGMSSSVPVADSQIPFEMSCVSGVTKPSNLEKGGSDLPKPRKSEMLSCCERLLIIGDLSIGRISSHLSYVTPDW
jgi:hypothetical protein